MDGDLRDGYVREGTRASAQSVDGLLSSGWVPHLQLVVDKSCYRLDYATLRYGMLCYAVLCYAMLCCGLQFGLFHWERFVWRSGSDVCGVSVCHCPWL